MPCRPFRRHGHIVAIGGSFFLIILHFFALKVATMETILYICITQSG